MTACPNCGDEYQILPHHWRQASDCDWPPFSQRQRELLKGLVMGDGSVTIPGQGQSRMTITSTNERWLRWLRAQFGIFAGEVTIAQTGDEVAANAQDHPSFDDSGGAWEYNDIYRIDIRAHPYLTGMRERWYPDGTIHYPESLVLTPISAKAWYCSDGGLSWCGPDRALAAFGTHNEADRPEYLHNLFERHGFSPNWSEPLIRFSTKETSELLDWMGTAPAGFEYKWEYRSREQYDRLKRSTGEDRR